MRKLLLLFLLSGMYYGIGAQVVFCPNGAEWNCKFILLPQLGPYPSYANEKIWYVRDSIVALDTVKVLQHRFYYADCYNSPGSKKLTLIKQKGDTVFFRNLRTQNSWQILFNFACQAGSGWTTYVLKNNGLFASYTYKVDSISIVQINGFNLRRLFSGSDVLTERLGWDNFLFRFIANQNSCDGYNFAGNLCYQDSTFGIAQFTEKSCSFSGIDGFPEYQDANSIEVFPNPASEDLNIQSSRSQSEQSYSVQVINLQGEQVFERKVVTDKVHIGGFAPGIYFLKVYEQGVLRTTLKFIKE